MREVILCTPTGEPTGKADLLSAHQNGGQCHLAFSVFIFRGNGTELLLQQRSAHKPVFPSLWANTCCSHPFPDEDIVRAGERRLNEELGFTLPLSRGEKLYYQADDPVTGLSEHEFDTILIGHAPADTELIIEPNPDEVQHIEWLQLDVITDQLETQPEKFAPWFHLAFPLACKTQAST